MEKEVVYYRAEPWEFISLGENCSVQIDRVYAVYEDGSESNVIAVEATYRERNYEKTVTLWEEQQG